MAKDTDIYFRPLANDERGLAFELPGEAKKWRVQRATGSRGRQEALFTFDHEPVEVSIEARPAALAEAMRAAGHQPLGRHRLIPVDAQGKQVGTQCAFIVFRSMDAEAEADEPRNAGDSAFAAPGPSNAAFDVAAIAKAISEGIQRTLEPTLTTMRSTLEKLVDANLATSTGLLRARLPLPPEPALEEFDEPEPPPAPLTPADQMKQILEMAGQVSSILQALQNQQQPAPRNSEPADSSSFAGLNGHGSTNGHGTNGAAG